MQKKKLIKLLSIPMIIIIAIIWFNWSLVVATFSSTGTYIIILLCAVPPGILTGEYINAKFRMKIGHDMMGTKLKNVMKQEQREKNARECLNRHRMIDPNLSAMANQEMEIVAREPSPSRQDAIQWEIFAFTSQEQKAKWNPLMGIDGIPSEYIFYVTVNCHTGEAYFRRFESYEDAVQKLDTLWIKGVEKREKSPLEKQAEMGMAEELGKLTAHNKSESDEKQEGNDE